MRVWIDVRTETPQRLAKFCASYFNTKRLWLNHLFCFWVRFTIFRHLNRIQFETVEDKVFWIIYKVVLHSTLRALSNREPVNCIWPVERYPRKAVDNTYPAERVMLRTCRQDEIRWCFPRFFLLLVAHDSPGLRSLSLSSLSFHFFFFSLFTTGVTRAATAKLQRIILLSTAAPPCYTRPVVLLFCTRITAARLWVCAALK